MSLQGLPSQPIGLEQLVQHASFPVYGLAETPDDLILHGMGYSTVGTGWWDTAPRSSPSPLDEPQYLWQVSLGYGSPPAAYGAWLERLEVRTTAVTRSPAETPDIAHLRQTYETHYHSDDEVPPLDSQRSLLIERFQLVDGEALAAVNYSPDPMPSTSTLGVLLGQQRHELAGSPEDVPILAPAPPPPTWTCTFRASQMWVDVQAYGWPQQDLFAVLHQLVALNNRPDVVARSQREISTWEQAIGWRRDENEV
jgi:hypothetical protein